MMKKFFCLLLCVLLLSSMAAVTVHAADVYVSFSDPWVRVEGSVTVSVHASVPVAGVDMRLIYDPEYLRYEGSYGGLGNAVVNAEGGVISIVDYHSQSEGDFTLNLSFIALKTGSTRIQMSACTVSDAGGDTMNATWGSSAITVTSGSSDATLQSLSIHPGSISPAFDPAVLEYRATVSNETTWIAVTAVKNEASAYPFVSGHDSLKVGENRVNITVTAGDGSQKVYTILVTREAAAAATPSPAPTAEPEPPEETEAPAQEDSGPVYAKVADGSLMEIGSFTAQQAPEGYSLTKISFGSHSLTAAVQGERTIVYLLSNDSNAGGFYLFDAETGTASPLNSFDAEAKTYVIHDPAQTTLAPPEGCTLRDYSLCGVPCQVYVPDDGGEYVVFFGTARDGEQGWYVYDTKEGTVQRLGLTEREEETAEPVYEPDEELKAELEEAQEELARARRQAAGMKRTASIAVVAALILLVVTAVLGYLQAKVWLREKSDDQEWP